MAFLDLSSVLKTLMEDSGVVKNRHQFADCMKVPTSVQIPLHDQYCKGVLPVYDFLKEVIMNWVHRQGGNSTVAELQKILREMGNNLCADKLGDLTESLKLSADSHIRLNDKDAAMAKTMEDLQSLSLAPHLVLNFVGRKEELDHLEETISSKCNPGVIITGEEGIGKTELVKKLMQNLNAKQNVAITWLTGETISIKGVLADLIRFNSAVESKDSGNNADLNIQEMLRRIYNNIRTNKEVHRWIVVFDHVEDGDGDESTHNQNQDLTLAARTLLQLGDYVFIIVTTRCKDTSVSSNIFRDMLESMELSTLKTEDAVLYLRSALRTSRLAPAPDTSHDDAIHLLCDRVSNYPADLQQLVRSFRKLKKTPTFTIHDYLDHISTKEEIVDSSSLKSDQELFKSFKTTWNQIKSGGWSKIELEILEILALLQGDAIRVEFVVKVFPTFHLALCDSAKIIPVAGKLQNQHLVRFESTTGSIQIDPKIQRIIRCQMSMNNKETRLLSTFWNCLQWENFLNSEVHEMLHIISIWKHTAKYPELVQSYSNHSVVIGFRLNELGMLSENYEFAQENHQKLCSIMGEMHISSLQIENYLAMGLRRRGKYEESLQKFRDVYEKQKSALGVAHAFTNATALNIASTLNILGRFTESLDWTEDVLKSLITCGESSREVCLTKQHLAQSMEKLGRLEEALELYREAWFQTKEAEEERHPETLTAMLNLAACLHEMGQHGEAKVMLGETIQAMEEVQGSDHQNSITARAYLGRTLYEMGEYQDALTAFEDVLRRREKVLGKDHPDTISALRNVEKVKTKVLNSN